MENENIPEPDISEPDILENEAVPDADIPKEETAEPPQEETLEIPAEEQMPESVPAVTDETVYTEILTEIQAGNEILGRIHALDVFMVALMLFLFVYLVIKNNVTRHY